MMGLGEQQQQATGGQPVGLGVGMAQQDNAEPEANVTEEEQQQYEIFVKNGLRQIYTGSPTTGDDVNSPLPTDLISEGKATISAAEGTAISPNIVKSLQGGDKPVMNLAVTGVALVKGLVDSAKKAGHRIDDDILYHGAVALLEELAEVSGLLGIHDYTEEETENSFYQALDMYREAATATGDINPDELKAGFEQIRQADAQGTLPQLLPGIEQRLGGQP